MTTAVVIAVGIESVMPMRFRLIAEGHTPSQRKRLYWGISFLIGKEVLFDCFGREDVFVRVAREKAVVFGKLKHIVISHDDWDHIAGLPYALRKNPRVTVHVCAGAKQSLKDTVRAAGAILHEIDGPCEIMSGLYSTGQMPAQTKHGFLYEQALTFDADRGRTLLCGCAHPGVATMAERARAVCGTRIDTVAGGFHLKDSLPEAIVAEIALLKELGVTRAEPMHCTGMRAGAMFKDAFDCCYV